MDLNAKKDTILKGILERQSISDEDMREYPILVKNALKEALDHVQDQFKANFKPDWYIDLEASFEDFDDDKGYGDDLAEVIRKYGYKDDRNKTLSAELLALDPGPSITEEQLRNRTWYTPNPDSEDDAPSDFGDFDSDDDNDGPPRQIRRPNLIEEQGTNGGVSNVENERGRNGVVVEREIPVSNSEPLNGTGRENTNGVGVEIDHGDIQQDGRDDGEIDQGTSSHQITDGGAANNLDIAEVASRPPTASVGNDALPRQIRQPNLIEEQGINGGVPPGENVRGSVTPSGDVVEREIPPSNSELLNGTGVEVEIEQDGRGEGDIVQGTTTHEITDGGAANNEDFTEVASRPPTAGDVGSGIAVNVEVPIDPAIEGDATISTDIVEGPDRPPSVGGDRERRRSPTPPRRRPHPSCPVGTNANTIIEGRSIPGIRAVSPDTVSNANTNGRNAPNDINAPNGTGAPRNEDVPEIVPNDATAVDGAPTQNVTPQNQSLGRLIHTRSNVMPNTSTTVQGHEGDNVPELDQVPHPELEHQVPEQELEHQVPEQELEHQVPEQELEHQVPEQELDHVPQQELNQVPQQEPGEQQEPGQQQESQQGDEFNMFEETQKIIRDIIHRRPLTVIFARNSIARVTMVFYIISQLIDLGIIRADVDQDGRLIGFVLVD